MDQLTTMEENVSDELLEYDTEISRVEEQLESRIFGQFVADYGVNFGGSWKFIILFGVFIAL